MRKVAMLAVAACAACSLLVDTGDLSNPSGAKDADSAPVAGDASDGAIDGDTTSDTGNDAANPGFCASHPGAIFCDDFDQPNRTDLRTEGWAPNNQNYPMGVPITTQFFSSPRSARFVWDWEDAGLPNRTGAMQVIGVPATLDAVTISMRVRPELSLAADEQTHAVSLRHCLVNVSPNGAEMIWQDDREFLGSYSMPFEKWTLTSITIKVRSDGCDVTVQVGDGNMPFVLPTKSVNLKPASDPEAVLGIDLGYDGHDAVGAVSFDDVLVVAIP